MSEQEALYLLGFIKVILRDKEFLGNLIKLESNEFQDVPAEEVLDLLEEVEAGIQIRCSTKNHEIH